MARGGRREGAGRPWGSRDRVKRRSASIAEIATRDALAFMQTNAIQIFEGDSVAFLIGVYRNERLPLRERMAAAMAVSPYERVRLTAVDMRIRDANGRSGWNPGWNDKDAAEKVRHAALRRIEVQRQGRPGARAGAPARVAFHSTHSVFGHEERLHPALRLSGYPTVNPNPISRHGCLT